MMELIAVALAWALVLGIPAAIAVYVGRMLWYAFFQRATVFEFQQGLKYRNGRLVGLVKPGSHWVRHGTTVVAIDMRESRVVLEGVEVIPRDSLPTRINVIAGFRVVDPVAAFTSVDDYREATSNMVLVALRKAALGLTSKELAQTTDRLVGDVRERTQDRQRELGVALTSLDITS